MADDALCEGVRTLLETAAGFLPVRGLGVVRPDGPDHVVLTYVDPFGATGYRPRSGDIPEAVRPRSSGLNRLTADELRANPAGLFESRLLHSWVPEDVRQEFGLCEVVTLPVPAADRATTFVLGLTEAVPLTGPLVSSIESLAAGVVEFLNRVESPHDELDRLRRLDAVDRLLPAFFRVLDVREIFGSGTSSSGSLGSFCEPRQRTQTRMRSSPAASPLTWRCSCHIGRSPSRHG